MRRRQSGFSLALFALAVLLVVVGLVALILSNRGSSEGDRSERARERFSRAHSAVVSFVSLNQRLPCPADPSVDTGFAAPDAPSATCTFPAGTLPWATLGMNRDDAYDPWGWKISYRVYTGNAGSLTQAGGTSMVSCDTSDPAPQPVTALAGNSGGLCRPTQDTLPATYLAGKGLSITDFGTVHADTAYVLVSHGASGLGAYTANGTRTALPSSANELTNTQAAGPFVAVAASSGLASDDANHFDDLLGYVSLQDLITRANLAARDWPDGDLAFNSATLAAVLGAAPAYGDLGVSTINFPSARVSGFAGAGTAQNITFQTSGGIEGLGGTMGAGNGSLSSVNNEGIRVDNIAVPGRRLALALNDFGTGNYNFFGFPIPYMEQVQLQFYSGGILKKTVVAQACNADGGLATFQDIDVGGGFLFDRVDITSVTSTLFLQPSSFFVSEVKVCAAGVTCQTGLQVANPSTLCP